MRNSEFLVVERQHIRSFAISVLLLSSEIQLFPLILIVVQTKGTGWKIEIYSNTAHVLAPPLVSGVSYFRS